MKKILSVLLPIILLLTPNLTVFASDTIINSEGSQAVPVTADVVATFEITVPSAIHITDFDETEFLIKGTGNISKYEYLSVDIPNTVNMTCVGEYSENLPITKSSDRFLREELMSDEGGTITCSIDSSTLPSGSWVGSLNINVSVKDLYYRLPDTLDYYTYTIVIKNIYDNSLQIVTAEVPVQYNPTTGKLGNATEWKYCRIHKEQNDGTWSTEGGWYTSEYRLASSYNIIYSNHDIINTSTGEVWQTKLCPD